MSHLPLQPSRELSEGIKRQGQDKKWYRVAVNVKGIHSWRKIRIDDDNVTPDKIKPKPASTHAQKKNITELRRECRDKGLVYDIKLNECRPSKVKGQKEKQRLKKERLEKERLEKEKERLEKERLEKESLEKERLQKEKERLEKERLEKERLEKERLEKRLEDERKEKERIEKERVKRERLEKERIEKERVKKERIEKERVKKERLEKERIEKERLEKERIEKERVKKERVERERLENERLKKEKLEKERVEKLEKERVEEERLEEERKEAERKESCKSLPEWIRVPDIDVPNTFYPVNTDKGEQAIAKISRTLHAKQKGYRDLSVLWRDQRLTRSVVGTQGMRSVAFILLMSAILGDRDLIKCHTMADELLVFIRPGMGDAFSFDEAFTRQVSHGVNESFTKELRQCSKPIFIIPLTVANIMGGQTHANVIVINRSQKLISLFDPFGKQNEPYKATMNAMRQYIMPTLGIQEYTLDEGLCPYGPQIYQKDIEMRGGFCQAWSQWFTIEVMLNPQSTATEIYNRMKGSMDGEQLLQQVQKFVTLTENVIHKEKEEIKYADMDCIKTMLMSRFNK
jgi:hypothetical protein